MSDNKKPKRKYRKRKKVDSSNPQTDNNPQQTDQPNTTTKLRKIPDSYIEQRLEAMNTICGIDNNNSVLQQSLYKQHNNLLPSIDLIHHINYIASLMMKDNDRLTANINNTEYQYKPKYECMDSSVCVGIAVTIEQYIRQQVENLMHNNNTDNVT